MVFRQKLTPATFLEAPRRSAAVPSPSGRLAFFTVSTHAFVDDGRVPGTTAKELCLLDLGTGTTWPFPLAHAPTIGDIVWVPSHGDGDDSDNDELLWLQPMADGSTEIVVAAATYGPNEQPADVYVAGRVPAPIRALRLQKLPDRTVAFVVTGQVGDNGGPYNERAQPMPGSSARIYDMASLHTIWYGRLRRESGPAHDEPLIPLHSDRSRCAWSLSPLYNALQHAPTGFEACLTADGSDDATTSYDIGPLGVVFTAHNPAASDPRHSSCTAVYYVALDSFAAPTTAKPVRITVVSSLRDGASLARSSASAGRATHPRFSPDGSMLACLWAPLACPADQRVYMGHIVSGIVHDVLATMVRPSSVSAEPVPAAGEEPLVPYSFSFAPSGRALFLQAQDAGRRSLFVLALRAGAQPRRIGSLRGSVSAYHLVRREKHGARDSGQDRLSAYAVLLSGSSFVESSFYHLVDLEDEEARQPRAGAAHRMVEPRVLSTSGDAARFGLSYDAQVEEMYFAGGHDGSYCVQAWMMRPSGAAEKTAEQTVSPDRNTPKWPLALLIHGDGGPGDALDDEWHARWNAAVWAEQGYVVVLPNITGGAGFGLAHTTRIGRDHADAPFDDLVQCMTALRHVPGVDCDRTIVAGAGYGSYLIAWLHGSPLGRQVRAVICHDPIFGWNVSGNPVCPDRLAAWKSNAAPTLVVHTDRDDRHERRIVAKGQAIFRALLFQGVPTRYLTFADESNAFVRPENALVWHRVVFAWLLRWRDVAHDTENQTV